MIEVEVLIDHPHRPPLAKGPLSIGRLSVDLAGCRTRLKLLSFEILGIADRNIIVEILRPVMLEDHIEASYSMPTPGLLTLTDQPFHHR